jgi:hypothetical protein
MQVPYPPSTAHMALSAALELPQQKLYSKDSLLSAGVAIMLAKMTSKNQLTLPKSVTAAVGSSEYFEVEARNGQIVLTPVRIQRGDAVRAKLAELGLQHQDIEDAVSWARRAQVAKSPRKK